MSVNSKPLAILSLCVMRNLKLYSSQQVSCARGQPAPRACQHKAARGQACARRRALLWGRHALGLARRLLARASFPLRDPDIKVQDIFARSQFRIERDGRRIAEVIGTAMRDRPSLQRLVTL